MEDSGFCSTANQQCLVVRFPCNSARSSGRRTPSLKRFEPPRKAFNLSPKPVPKKVISTSWFALGKTRSAVEDIDSAFCRRVVQSGGRAPHYTAADQACDRGRRRPVGRRSSPATSPLRG